MADNDPARKPFNPQNPDPATTAGLEPGGGVAPGDTPPAESAVGGDEHEPPQRRRAGGVIVIAVAAIIFLLVALGLIGRAVGLF